MSKKYLQKYLESLGVTLNGNNPQDIQIHDERIFNKLYLNPSIAFGEGYMHGWWDCEKLDELFYRISKNYNDKIAFRTRDKLRIYLAYLLLNLQSHWRSQKVAEVHYNLGNELYRAMLGKTLAYTCAYWKNADNLDQAQLDKFDLVCRKVNLTKGDKVLELGCGWGTLSHFMASRYGCEVVAVNISTEQVRYAKEICKDLPVSVYLSDYRDDHIYNPNKIQFDKVVSVGLCEHVGHKNYRPWMELVRKNIKSDGLFLLHTIGKNESSHVCDPWINKYIFPNGILPSLKLLTGAMEDLFVVEDLHNFGANYDKTLMAWHKNFNDHWPELSAMYDQTFFRMWNYYLLSCAGGFRSRSIQLWQFVLSPHGVPGGYQTVR